MNQALLVKFSGPLKAEFQKACLRRGVRMGPKIRELVRAFLDKAARQADGRGYGTVSEHEPSEGA